MNKTFFIGDTHFGHANILKYESRPFADVEHMDKALITNWNKVVGKSDRVFMLGDFALANKSRICEITEQLHGYKILIMGNHDGYNHRFYLDAGFEEVSRYPVIIQNFWILSHMPMYINENMPYANIYAHVHSNPSFRDFTKQTMCVSVERDHMKYSPIEFNMVKELMDIN